MSIKSKDTIFQYKKMFVDWYTNHTKVQISLKYYNPRPKKTYSNGNQNTPMSVKRVSKEEDLLQKIVQLLSIKAYTMHIVKLETHNLFNNSWTNSASLTGGCFLLIIINVKSFSNSKVLMCAGIRVGCTKMYHHRLGITGDS